MDKYRKLKVIGKGSFGFAVLVQSVLDRQTYVMKIIDVSKMDKKQREDAINEVHVLKAMRHPYIITYKESFMDKKCLCIVMDYADGGDLYTKIANQKKVGKVMYSEDQILDWFVQMALAIKHIHDRKILHRDLKTQNIFMTQTNQIKIGDFGIARVLQHTYDCAQTAIGTPYYLSPEICQEKPYNQKSDIWSLGCILYEMVTLRHAFDANSMKGLVLKILRGTYPPIPSTYSQDLNELIADMLIKDPTKRPSMRKILEKEFLSRRISKLLTSTIAKSEFTATFVKKHIAPFTKENEESKDGSYNVEEETLSDQRSQQKQQPSIISKEAIKKKQRSEAQEEDQQDYASSSFDISDAKERIPAIKEIDNRQRDNNYFKPNMQKPISAQPQIGSSSQNSITKSSQESQYKVSKESKTYLQKEEVKGRQKVFVSKQKNVSDDDEDFEEPSNNRAVPSFLKNIPGITATDSDGYRIEALRVYLENMLGDIPFIAAYKHLVNLSVDDDSADDELEGILGRDRMKFVTLIHQLIVCEDSYYANKNE